ncbi:MAG: enoyl-CoA hydratase/isomerase family protein [Acidimicrobiia bacterium]
MSEALIRYEVTGDGAVHTITLDKGPGNVIDIAMCAELRPAIEAAAGSRTGKVLVIRGAGKHFSFGASVEEHLPDKAAEMLAAFGGVLRDLVGFPYPTVAGVQGRCLGGGLELALACGIIIAEEGAVLAAPEIQLGVLPPAATALVTSRAAEDVLLTGRNVDASEAQRLGLVNQVVADGELDKAVNAFVEQHFLPRSASSLRLATKAIRQRRHAEFEARLAEAEGIYLEELLVTHDGVEGIKAFLEKRPPNWKDA